MTAVQVFKLFKNLQDLFFNTFSGDMTYKGCKYSDGQELIGDKGTWQVTTAVVNLRQGDLAGNNSCSQPETRGPGR